MQFGDWLQYSPAVGNMQGGVSRCCRQICACSSHRPITVQHFFTWLVTFLWRHCCFCCNEPWTHNLESAHFLSSTSVSVYTQKCTMLKITGGLAKIKVSSSSSGDSNSHILISKLDL